MNTFKGNANPAAVLSGTGRIQSAPGTVPAGSYGYLITGWPDAGNKPFTIFGVINLDGAGNLNGSYTLVNGRPAAFPGTLSGAYSVNPDGTGSMTLNFDHLASRRAGVEAGFQSHGYCVGLSRVRQAWPLR